METGLISCLYVLKIFKSNKNLKTMLSTFTSYVQIQVNAQTRGKNILVKLSFKGAQQNIFIDGIKDVGILHNFNELELEHRHVRLT